MRWRLPSNNPKKKIGMIILTKLVKISDFFSVKSLKKNPPKVIAVPIIK
jgi:hypothetical protein